MVCSKYLVHVFFSPAMTPVENTLTPVAHTNGSPTQLNLIGSSVCECMASLRKSQEPTAQERRLMVAISAGSLPQNSMILLPPSNLPNFHVGALVFSLPFRYHSRHSTTTTDERTAATLRWWLYSILLKYRIPPACILRGNLKSQILSQNYCLFPNLQLWDACSLWYFIFLSKRQSDCVPTNKVDTREYVQHSSAHLASKHVT
jgi:hypothetical protein